MRNLITSDVFAFARIVKASGIRDELTAKMMELQKTENADLRRVGLDTVLMIIEALSEKKAERSIYEFLGPIMEMTADEVAALPANEFIDAIKRIGEENDLASFFSVVSGALGKN